MKGFKTIGILIGMTCSNAMAIDFELSQASSYEVDGQCYCDSNADFGNGLADKKITTPIGELSPQVICEDIRTILGEGATENRIPYNDIQCGNGPDSEAIDEIDCPGRLDIGVEGCDQVGPEWDLVSVYGSFPTTPPTNDTGDNNPPSARFANLQNGDVIPQGDDFSVEVLAQDDDGIRNVILFLDGVFVRQIDEAPFFWDDDVLQNLAPGVYSLIAVAEDNVGLTAEAEAVFTIVETTPEPTPDIEPNKRPELSFVSPEVDETFGKRSGPVVLVDASDNDGIRHVTLYLDGVFVRREFKAPYRWNNSPRHDRILKNLRPGTYTLVAVAEDNTGLTQEKEISFTIGKKRHKKVKDKHRKSCHVSQQVKDFRSSDETRTFRSRKIDISRKGPVNLSMEVEGIGPMEREDQLKVFYIVDGEKRVKAFKRRNSFSRQKINFSNISGKTLEIVIKAKTSSARETYKVSDIKISQQKRRRH